MAGLPPKKPNVTYFKFLGADSNGFFYTCRDGNQKKVVRYSIEEKDKISFIDAQHREAYTEELPPDIKDPGFVA